MEMKHENLKEEKIFIKLLNHSLLSGPSGEREGGRGGGGGRKRGKACRKTKASSVFVYDGSIKI